MSQVHTGKVSEPVFDWYQASVPVSEDDVIETLVDLFSADTRAVRGIPQYDRSIGLAERRSTFVFCEISYGGNGGAYPHVKATGHHADRIATVLKRHWPVHSVSRCDSAYDFVGEGLYDQMRPILEKCHHQWGVFRNEMGFPENGRTYYLGSPKSPVRLRCYEKDKERASKGLAGIPGHLRVELQVRPRTKEKTKYAPMTAGGVWGASRWSRAVIGQVLDLRPEPIKQAPPMSKTPEQKLIDVFTQYARTLNDVGEEEATRLLRAFYREGTKGLSTALSEPLAHD